MIPVLTFCNGCTFGADGQHTFEFKDGEGASHHLTFKASALRALAPLMLNILQDAETGASRGQVAALTSARAGYLENGTPLLGLGLNGVEVAVALNEPEALEMIAACINEFHFTSTASRARH
jgi:hypothetical protein